MKVVAVIASYRRGQILQDVIDQIQPHVHRIVLVGSSSWAEGENGCNIEKTISYNNRDVNYVDHKNNPLGSKWQAGLNYARQLHPDAVLICGSDDLITPDWIPEAIELLQDYRPAYIVDVLGFDSWYVYNVYKKRMVECSYRIRTDPIGAGRIIRKQLLDVFGWQIFPNKPGIGCDAYSFSLLKKHARRVYKTQNKLVCVKAGWQCMDTWDQIVDAQSLNIRYLEPGTTESFLRENFPKIDFNRYAV